MTIKEFEKEIGVIITKEMLRKLKKEEEVWGKAKNGGWYSMYMTGPKTIQYEEYWEFERAEDWYPEAVPDTCITVRLEELSDAKVLVTVSNDVVEIDATGDVDVVLIDWDNGEAHFFEPSSNEDFEDAIDFQIEDLKTATPAPTEYDEGFTEENLKVAIALLSALKRRE